MDDFLKVNDKILNVYATKDKIFDISLKKLDFLTDSKKKYVLVNSNQHAFPFLQPKETAAIINSCLEKLKNEKF